MNLEWAKKWMGSYNRAGLERVVQLYADDVKFEDVTLGDRANGKLELKQAFTSVLTRPGASENVFTVTPILETLIRARQNGPGRRSMLVSSWRCRQRAKRPSLREFQC